MSDIFFLVLRKLRTPLIVLISVYAIATLGMTLIPGIDKNGDPWHMSFFHAFYFVSFMGTTIGFGEIPHEFTDTQRAWVLLCIYTSVISWLYAIGTMLTLAQDPTFKSAITNRAFERSIRSIDLPFHIICGYGSTGASINSGLSNLGIQTVVIDKNSERSSSFELQDLTINPILLSADATIPRNLIAAGINHERCKGLIAVTEDDHTNLQIALNCKLLNKQLPVICRSEIEDEGNNMASFGTDNIINPYLNFAESLSILAKNPSLHKLHNWFINQQHSSHFSERRPPNGLWIICGHGRLGKAIREKLNNPEIQIKVIDPNPQESNAPVDSITGRGTEANTLEQANITEAAVIIAATDDDANNLSILLTAKELNPKIYSIARVSVDSNEPLFIRAKSDVVVRVSQIIANHALTLISRPLVTNFIQYSNKLSQDQVDDLVDEINQLTHNSDPATWRLVIDQNHATALHQFLNSGFELTLSQICEHRSMPNNRAIPLLLKRNGNNHLIPSLDMPLMAGDEVLFCGDQKTTLLPQHMSNNIELIDTLINNNQHYIPLLRWLSRTKRGNRFHSKSTPVDY